MRLALVCGTIILTALPAAAQGSGDRHRRFKPAARFDYEVGLGERAFQSDTSNQPEQRCGVQASLGR